MRPRGFVATARRNAVWGMQFVWPIKADYRIAYCPTDYGQTVIAREARDYVWIMARTPSIRDADYGGSPISSPRMGYDVGEAAQGPAALARLRAQREHAVSSSLAVALRRWVDSSAAADRPEDGDARGIDWPRVVPFVPMHLGCLGALWTGVSASAVAVAGGAVRACACSPITAFYHRYFSHRAFRTSRASQFAVRAARRSAVQRGPLWWAAHHRHHHAHADRPGDAHSPRQHGFLWSHIGWFLARANFATRCAARAAISRASRNCAGSTATTWRCRPHWRRAVRARARGSSAPTRARHRRRGSCSCGDSASRPSCCSTRRSPSTRSPTASGAPLRDARRLAQQRLARADHVRRGLAQQPPPLPGRGAPGLLLVADRPDLLRAARCSPRSGSCGTCAACRLGPDARRAGRTGRAREDRHRRRRHRRQRRRPRGCTREHEVTVFEAAVTSAGTATRTTSRWRAARCAVDTGFIVYNDRTYPRFTRLLDELGVATQRRR